jgi:hypothetical protein
MATLKGETENRTLNLDASTKIEDRIRRFDERLARYIPPRESWIPAEEALYGPTDTYRVPIDEARAMQLRAVRNGSFGRAQNRKMT